MSESTECLHGMEPSWCSICLHGHGSVRATPKPRDSGVEDRQGIVNSLCDLAGHPRVATKGASEPKSVLVALAARLGLPVDTDAPKPLLARSMVLAAGLTWDEFMDSSSTPSGGGSAITNRGMARLLAAARSLLVKVDA